MRLEALIPQDGSATRSGSARRGARVSVATFGSVGSGVPAAGPCRGRVPTPSPPLTTCTVTVAVAFLAVMWNSRANAGRIVSVTL